VVLSLSPDEYGTEAACQFESLLNARQNVKTGVLAGVLCAA